MMIPHTARITAEQAREARTKHVPALSRRRTGITRLLDSPARAGEQVLAGATPPRHHRRSAG
jgi:hypothetical protein